LKFLLAKQALGNCGPSVHGNITVEYLQELLYWFIFVITKILKLHQLPLTDTLKYSLKLKVGTIFFLWVTMNYLKHAAYMTLVQCGCRATGIVLQRNMGAHNKEVLSDMSLHW
jgi:hypothetical protein